MVPRIRINQAISAPELRLIGETGENIGIKSRDEALILARNAGLDLIEISPTARPPVARIMDWGKYQYQQEKDARKAKKKSHEVEIKGIRVRLGTGSHDLIMKAKQAEKFLKAGHRLQIQLTLRGREKYIDKNFVHDRLTKLLEAITVPHKIAEKPKKGPRGLIMTIEPEHHGKNKQSSPAPSPSNQKRESTQAPTAPKPL